MRRPQVGFADLAYNSRFEPRRFDPEAAVFFAVPHRLRTTESA